MIEAKSVKLEDGIEYMVIDEIDNATTTYYFLANIDDEEVLVGLDSDQEFDRAMLMFMKKNKGYFG